MNVIQRNKTQGMTPLEIAKANSTVRDNGRRGAPRAGCDCVQCFGYCMTRPDAADRFNARKEGDK